MKKQSKKEKKRVLQTYAFIFICVRIVLDYTCWICVSMNECVYEGINNCMPYSYMNTRTYMREHAHVYANMHKYM